MGDSESGNSVLLKTPWRNVGKDPWTEKVYKSLKEEIVTHELLKKAKIEYFNVLLVGEISAGKSSFFNTVESVFSDHVTMKANAGAVEKSLTTQYRTYKVRAKDHKNKPIKFRFCDSMGLEGGNVGLNPEDVAKILDGHVQDMAELSLGGLGPGDRGYNESPKAADKIHCVAFVVDSSGMDYLGEGVITKMKAIRVAANKRCLNPIVILTRVDQVCDETAKDITKVYNSSTIKDTVRDVSEKFGITENMIYPMQNYSSETDKELGIDILTLRTLRQILRCSQDYLQDRVDRDNEELRQARRRTLELEKSKTQDTVDISDDSDDSDDSDAEEGASGRIKPPPIPPSGSMDHGNARSGTALYKFTAQNHKQVSLKRGVNVQELMPDNGGWTKVQTKDGKKGLVPTNYIEWEVVEEKSVPPPPPYSPRSVKCLHDFTASTAEEIDIEEDDKVELIDDFGNGWTKIKKKDDSEGLVPTSFLENIADTIPIVKTPPAPPKKKTCVALYAYSATDHDQLNMRAGEQFTILKEKLEGGWSLVKNENGHKGKIPASFVKIDTEPVSKSSKAAPPPPSSPAAAVQAPLQAPSAPAPMQAPPPPPAAATPPAPAPPTKLSCTALYEFKQNHPDTLDMAQGEQFTVLDHQTEWTVVQNTSGREGKVPSTYIKIGQLRTSLGAPPPPPLQVSLGAPPPPPLKASVGAPPLPPLRASVGAPPPPPLQASVGAPSQPTNSKEHTWNNIKQAFYHDLSGQLQRKKKLLRKTKTKQEREKEEKTMADALSDVIVERRGAIESDENNSEDDNDFSGD